MPGFDGTGPRGMGPMTGGGRGFCSSWGLGRGGGFGWRMPYPMAGQWSGPQVPYSYPYSGAAYPGAMPYGYAGMPAGILGTEPYAPQMTREQELDFLRNQAEAIKGQLEQIDARMSELEKEK